ncbi:hypothetical protein GGF38_002776, partial [Coemansia sp. RSA 25]
NFRAMVCSLISQTYTPSLTLANHRSRESSLADASGCPWIICPKFNDYSTHRLAKRLDIRVELGCIYLGMALELLSRVPYKDCIFPAVRTVAFTFSINPDDTGDDIDDSVVQANTAAFVQRLLQLAPRFRECHMDDRFDYEEVSKVDLGRFNSLVRQILANVDHLKYNLGYELVRMDLDYAGMCNLVHIDYAFDLDDWPCFQLVQQCAPILKSLILRAHLCMLSSGLDTSMLIQDTAGSCVTECRVFMHASHPRLRSVAIDLPDGFITEEYATYTDFIQFVLRIGPGAVVRVLHPMALEQDIPRVLQLLGEHTSIQVLSMDGAALTVLDVVTLIKSLPLLSDLRLDVPKLDSHLADIPKSQLFETLIESHAPMGRQLRHWIEGNCQAPLEDLALFTVLLVSLCPNLDFMDVSHKLIPHFGRYMKSCTASDPFQKYEQLLQSLQLPLATEHTTVRQRRCPNSGY